MAQISYSDIFSIVHERGYDEDIQAGDLVRVGANHFPHFTVMALVGDKAWVRNVQNGADGITSIDRCRKINGAPAL